MATVGVASPIHLNGNYQLWSVLLPSASLTHLLMLYPTDGNR